MNSEVINFFNQVETVLKGEKFKDCNFPLFRGHSKADHSLLPTLYRVANAQRKDVWHLENNLYSDFRSLVGPRVRFNNSWEELYLMRHEGIPTRLLDWTEHLGTALFFALDSKNIEGAHIWVLNPYWLNRENPDIGESVVNPEQDLEDYQKKYASRGCVSDLPELHKLPLAIYPLRTNERIFAQRGLFTIHGLDERPLEESCPQCLERIEIPDNMVADLKLLLKTIGINKYSVYPDIKGLCEYLKEVYEY